jgi:hypothetical protein
MAGNLVYTVALDPPGATGHRNLAKVLVSSLLRTRFTGDILVFHNSPGPLFMVPRTGLREIRIELPRAAVDMRDFAVLAQSRKHAVAEQIQAAQYRKVMFIDCDCVVLRNIDHLFAGNFDLTVFSEPGTRIQADSYCGYLTAHEERKLVREGINSGTWVVAGERFGELLERWRKAETKAPRQVCLREQSAFNRVVLDWDGGLGELPPDEIALPLCNHTYSPYRCYTNSAIVHAAGGDDVNHKLRFLFSAFTGAFLFDPQLALFNILEM